MMKPEQPNSPSSAEVIRTLAKFDLRDKWVYCPFDEDSSSFVSALRSSFVRSGLGSLMWSSLDAPDLKRTADGEGGDVIERAYSGFWSSDSRYMIGHFPKLVVVSQPPARIAKRVLTTLIESGARFLIRCSVYSLLPQAGEGLPFRAYRDGSISVFPANQSGTVGSLGMCWVSNLATANDPAEPPATIPAPFHAPHVVAPDTGAGLFLTVTGAEQSAMELVAVPFVELPNINPKRWEVVRFYPQIETHAGLFKNRLLLRKKQC